MTDYTKISTTALVTKLARLEALSRYARGPEQLRVAAEWHAVRRELDSRSTDRVLSSLQG
jgi:hypothetical protein